MKTPFQTFTKALSIVALCSTIFVLPALVYENKELIYQFGFWVYAAIGVGTSILFTWVWLTRKQITEEEVEKSEKMKKMQKRMYATACFVFAIHCSIMFPICNASNSHGGYQTAIALGLLVSFAAQFATLAIEAIFHPDRCYE